ncbi:MAG: hypothetical protein GYA15_10755 [Leptolinea sp.]|jgi:cytochrome c-type biogenesis protein CcmH|nr:hypothetical protein [Leptolinea sp.]
MKRLTCGLIFALTIMIISPVTPVLAQQPTPSDDQVNALARQMYCPVCENTPLDVCPTKACAQWRELIREKLSLGWTEQQIKDFFAAQYGDRVLAEPPVSGTNQTLYLLPPVFLLIAMVLVIRRLASRHEHQMVMEEEPPAPEAPEIYLSRVEEELEEFKRQ